MGDWEKGPQQELFPPVICQLGQLLIRLSILRQRA